MLRSSILTQEEGRYSQAEYNHAADVNRRKHEEDFVPKVRDERGGDFSDNKVKQPLRGAGRSETVVPCASREDICHIDPSAGRKYNQIKDCPRIR